MKQIRRIQELILIIFALTLFSFQVQAQSNAKNTSNSSSGRGVIVGKDGQAFRTNPNGECNLTIPDWLLERIKKSPNKYRLKISIRKVPSKILESELSDNIKAGGPNDLQLKFSYTVSNGSKKVKGDYQELINKSTIGTVAAKNTELPAFALSNPNEPFVIVSILGGKLTPGNVVGLTGEPIPGAEIYVELEPDDEP